MSKKAETTEPMKALHSALIETFIGSTLPADVKIGVMSNVLGRALVTSGLDLDAVMDVMQDNLRQGILESTSHLAVQQLVSELAKEHERKQ